MPPQGQSAAFAIEDAVLISRVFERFSKDDIPRIFEVYEKIRRPRLDKAYKDAVWGWSQIKDKSWFHNKFIEWATWIFLWAKRDSYEADLAYDVRTEKLEM